MRAGDKILINQERINYFPSQVSNHGPIVWVPIEIVKDNQIDGKLLRKLSKNTGASLECSEENLLGVIALTHGTFKAKIDPKIIKWIMVDPISRNLSREMKEERNEKCFYVIHDFFWEEWTGVVNVLFYSNQVQFLQILQDLIHAKI